MSLVYTPGGGRVGGGSPPGGGGVGVPPGSPPGAGAGGCVGLHASNVTPWRVAALQRPCNPWSPALDCARSNPFNCAPWLELSGEQCGVHFAAPPVPTMRREIANATSTARVKRLAIASLLFSLSACSG